MNRFVPLVLAGLAACGGGRDNPIEPSTPRNDITNLEPGEMRVLAPADITDGINLASVSEPREYVIIVGNTGQSASENVASYIVRGNLSTGASLRAVESAAINPDLITDVETAGRAQIPQRLLEKRVRAFERKALKLTRRGSAAGTQQLSMSRSVGVASVPVVGERINLKVPDGAGDNLCQDFFQTQAVVAAVSQRAILAVDTLDGDPATLFSQADFDAIAAEFDNVTYPTDEAWFGTPTDIDANQRVIMLFTGRVNRLTPAGTPQGTGYVAGFFFAGDFFPPTAPTGQFACPQSNQAEIFYLLAPDPTGLKHGNIRSSASVRQGTRGTIAHEFQHMINGGRRFVGGVAEEFEVSWLDEGLAHLGEEVVGRRVRGFGDVQSLSHAELLPNEAARNDYDAFFFQNLARFRFWLQRPDTSSGISEGAAENLSSRGAAWAFVRYAADHFSNGDPRNFIRRLVTGPDTGLVNFNRVTGAPLDTVVAGWLVSNYADDFPGMPIPNARTQYRSFNMRSVMTPVAQGSYPLRVQALTGGTGSMPGTNRTGSGTYYTLSVAANAGPKNVQVLNSGGTTLVSYPGAHIYVARVR